MQRRLARTIRFLLAWAILALATGAGSPSFSAFDAAASAEVVLVAEARDCAKPPSVDDVPVEAAPSPRPSRDLAGTRSDLTADPIVAEADEPTQTTERLFLVRYRYLQNSALLC